MNIGDKYGRLTVIGILGVRSGKINVRCDCGTEKILPRALIKSGNTKSCGCLKSDDPKQRFTKHGAVQTISGKRKATPEYRSWQLMRNRCLNKRSKDYPYYGGRGIQIDPAWHQFERFLSDMGLRPSPQHTLDRIDGDKGYTKNNCRWATRTTQARNRAYAKTRTWELAELLGVKVASAAHYIWMVRAKDKGDTKYFDMDPAREKIIRDFMNERGL